MKSLTVLFLLALTGLNAQALPIHSNLTAEDFDRIIAGPGNYNYEGIVKLNNCSGAIIKFEASKPTDKAIVLTNGHCFPTGVFGGMVKPGEFVYNKAAKRSFQLLDKNGTLTNKTVSSSKVIYVTMTGTDISMYELDLTYADLKSKYDTEAIVLESAHPTVADPIQILSGYFQIGYECTIDKFIYQLKEAGYVMNDSIRYSATGCKTIHGTSGSPILSARTHRIVGINNTGNDDGQMCTMDNPCEVDQSGHTFAQKGLSYGQETYQIYTCLNSASQFDLTLPGCKLFRNGRRL
ncbi:MAG: trypsin-like peptidase domain-containing protein [Bdellovibrionales bacterium]|nr:trypsin-like peptidase domain-containing protein [Bdellovibrionales bacterium]